MGRFCQSPWTSQLFILCLVIVLVAPIHAVYRVHHVSHSGIRSADVVSPGDFIDELFKRYGSNGSLDYEQLKKMFNNLRIGKEDKKTLNNPTVNDKCFSTSSVLDVFSINKTALTKQSFNKICPAIVQQIDSRKCGDNTEEKKPVVASRAPKGKAWGYGFLAVTIISCASLFGAFVVPFMRQDFYKKLLLFMVSLAVGVLAGSGIFHLIPSAFGYGQDEDVSYLYKCCVIVGGIYFFFCMEYIMKMYVRFKDESGMDSGHGHFHYLSNDKKHQHQIPDNGIAAAQLEMYNVKEDHHHGHSENFCIGNGYFPNKPELALVGAGSDSKILTNSQPSINIVDPKDPERRGNKKKGKIAPVAWMIILGDGVHNFIDGLAIGAGFSTSTFDGISTSLAIFCEELPHELGDFAVLLNAGMSYKQALLCNFLSAMSCFIGLVIGLLLGYTTSAVKWIYALAGGMFLYISLVDMMQEATEMSCKEGKGSVKNNLKAFALQAFGILFGFSVMFILALYAADISV